MVAQETALQTLVPVEEAEEPLQEADGYQTEQVSRCKLPGTCQGPRGLAHVSLQAPAINPVQQISRIPRIPANARDV